MLLPAIQYGPWPEVKRRMARVVTQLKRGAGLIELMTTDGMLDTDETPGDLVMVRSILGPESHFHCFAPWRQARESLLRDHPRIIEVIFAESLKTSWGVLGLMSSDNDPWVWPKERHQGFLTAALTFWDELDAVGARYFTVGQGRRLWSVPISLHYVLANMGVPNDALRAPLPPGGLRALLRQARPAAQA